MYYPSVYQMGREGLAQVTDEYFSVFYIRVDKVHHTPRPRRMSNSFANIITCVLPRSKELIRVEFSKNQISLLDNANDEGATYMSFFGRKGLASLLEGSTRTSELEDVYTFGQCTLGDIIGRAEQLGASSVPKPRMSTSCEF
jgi:hypothetical protein